MKFALLWLTLTVVILIGWPLGFALGNAMMQTSSPQLSNGEATATALIFAAVAVVNALLQAFLFWHTASFNGRTKWLYLVIFLFGLQYLLMQMETWFFGENIQISNAQVMSILIAGLIISVLSTTVGVWLAERLHKSANPVAFKLDTSVWRKNWGFIAVLSVLVYPALYFVFGYYVAWQNDALRMFYSQSTQLNSFFTQLWLGFESGLYFFQIPRSLLWVAITFPIAQMLSRTKWIQYVLIAAMTALLTSTQLFIPNPYMPKEVAHIHFVETSLSNLLWSLAMVFAFNWKGRKSPSAELVSPAG